MKADVDYCRDTEFVVDIHARPNATCPQCGSGEVHQYAQTLDMPMYWRCLRCGHTAPSGTFNRTQFASLGGGSEEDDDGS